MALSNKSLNNWVGNSNIMTCMCIINECSIHIHNIMKSQRNNEAQKVQKNKWAKTPIFAKRLNSLNCGKIGRNYVGFMFHSISECFSGNVGVFMLINSRRESSCWKGSDGLYLAWRPWRVYFGFFFEFSELTGRKDRNGKVIQVTTL